MNRQALPSIVCSVSIVCFFAIALYPRDGETRKLAQRDGPTTPRAGSPKRPGSPGGNPPGGEVRTRAISAGVSNIPVVSAAPVRQAATRQTAATLGPRELSRETGRGTSRGRVNEAAAAVRVASARASQAETPSAPAKGRAESTPRSLGKLARAPFTVVGSGETMADVARRVYGHADDVESLWRANRDVAREPGSPLAPGTVLHTPAMPLR
jgi:nucleoid-associated protein YgaU